ncbi:MAG: hypothetical protein WD045_12410 [Pirellulaceae bacterium]
MSISDYFSRLSGALGQGWNRFWFQRTDPAPLAVLRIVLGLISLIYALSFTSSLTTWFASDGILPVMRTFRMTGASEPDVRVLYWSLFYYVDDATGLWVLHLLSLVAILGFTIGLATRWTGIATVVFVISYAQRAPMLMSLLEPLLCPMLLYVVLAPCGAYYSVDAYLKSRGNRANDPIQFSAMAHLALRLAQVHLSMFYLMLGLTKLSSFTWWNGEAIWFLIAQTENRLVDWTFLRNTPLVVFGWTHFVVLFELLFGIFCWVKLARPLLVLVSIPHWVLLGLLTGQWQFALLMIVVNVVLKPWEPLEKERPAESLELQQPAEFPESARGVPV